ncbi:unnamed protein product [Fraxinus pennsylvanica]|uniref:Uncharacterized protein n=1 Tax=Fraxinus pennsylvanica TaxID=56036 RepID=A0AAD2AC31_9LAMI|nr:unnamed protein product [Fraxinus pennsylvanica]
MCCNCRDLDEKFGKKRYRIRSSHTAIGNHCPLFQDQGKVTRLNSLLKLVSQHSLATVSHLYMAPPSWEFPGLIKISVHGGRPCEPNQRTWAASPFVVHIPSLCTS